MNHLDPAPKPHMELLRRSLARGRLGHAYLFVADDIERAEDAAIWLAQALNCTSPARGGEAGGAVDPCGICPNCQRIRNHGHPDVQWLRPGKRSRILDVDTIRGLIQALSLRPHEARFKMGILVNADRMNEKAANAFLKTLEEPPAGSVLILLTTEPQQLLETILSRCLRLNCGGDLPAFSEPALAWVQEFATKATGERGSLRQRYALLGTLLTALGALREAIEGEQEARSPLARFPDAEPDQRERWEDELNAAVEAEYRRRRLDYLGALHWWLRDVWLTIVGRAGPDLRLPQLGPLTATVAERLEESTARANLEAWDRTQRLLHTNVQEALALEVGLLRLDF